MLPVSSLKTKLICLSNLQISCNNFITIFGNYYLFNNKKKQNKKNAIALFFIVVIVYTG